MGTLTLDIGLARRGFDLAVALEVADVVALVGPSGAGKTSVLRAIAGLERPDRGRITFDRDTWFAAGSVDGAPNRRPVGFVFQDYALFPHMTVAANVAFGARARAPEIMERVGIAHLANARPRELSGGERQRVAVARALAREPAVLLLDEPTAALDLLTRDRVRAELAEIIRAAQVPTIIVTHDFAEAAMLADRVGVLVTGRLRQLGPAHELLGAPNDTFVAGLTGCNVVPGVVTAASGGVSSVMLDSGHTVESPDTLTGEVAAVIHPRLVAIADTHAAIDSGTNLLRAPITALVPVGGGLRVRIGPLTADLDADAQRPALTIGQVVTAAFPVAATRLVRIDPPQPTTGADP